MPLYDLPNSTVGLTDVAIQTIQAGNTSGSPLGFTSLLLTFIFFTVFIGGIMRQKLRTATADYPMWAVVASLSTFLVALTMTLKAGLIGIDLLVIVTVITIFSSVWFFMDRKVSEI